MHEHEHNYNLVVLMTLKVTLYPSLVYLIIIMSVGCEIGIKNCYYKQGSTANVLVLLPPDNDNPPPPATTPPPKKT